jgi:hypothetical protein
MTLHGEADGVGDGETVGVGDGETVGAEDGETVGVGVGVGEAPVRPKNSRATAAMPLIGRLWPAP